MLKTENLGNFTFMKKETICFSLKEWAVLSFHPYSKELDLKSSLCGSMNHSSHPRHAPWTLMLFGWMHPIGGRHPRLERTDASHRAELCKLFSWTSRPYAVQPLTTLLFSFIATSTHAPFILNNVKHPKCVMFFLPFCLCPVYVYMYIICITNLLISPIGVKGCRLEGRRPPRSSNCGFPLCESKC